MLIKMPKFNFEIQFNFHLYVAFRFQRLSLDSSGTYFFHSGGIRRCHPHAHSVKRLLARGNVILAPDCGSESFCSMFGQVDCKAGLSVFMRLISDNPWHHSFLWLILSFFSHLDSGTGRSAHAGAVVQ